MQKMYFKNGSSLHLGMISKQNYKIQKVGNCIGLRNHKYFVLFEFYATVCLLICTVHIAVSYLLNGGELLKVNLNFFILLSYRIFQKLKLL